MREIKKRSGCAVSNALDLIGDKWTLLIIRDLLFYDKNTYGDFLKSDEKIATNILADRLTLLENNGIIKKQVHPENKTKYLYRITEKGLDLLPIIAELVLWSIKHLNINISNKSFAPKLLRNKEEALEEVRQKIRSQMA